MLKHGVFIWVTYVFQQEELANKSSGLGQVHGNVRCRNIMVCADRHPNQVLGSNWEIQDSYICTMAKKLTIQLTMKGKCRLHVPS